MRLSAFSRSASILPRRALCVYRGVHGDYARCAAVFPRGHRARNEELRRQYHWTGTKRILERAAQGSGTRVSIAAALEDEYQTGACENARIAWRFRRRARTDSLHRGGGTRGCEIDRRSRSKSERIHG